MNYCADTTTIDGSWANLAHRYSEPARHYHTLNHISGLIAVLDTAHEQVVNADALLFAAFYHDAIYDALRNDNEDLSAELAQQSLLALNVPAEISGLCNQHILATKMHEDSNCTDTNLFTDADLAILGAMPPLYREYRNNIRKEYSIYPDDVYSKGRAKVLEHFLSMPRIYKTDFFRERYEAQARENISSELKELQNV